MIRFVRDERVASDEEAAMCMRTLGMMLLELSAANNAMTYEEGGKDYGLKLLLAFEE